MVHDDLPSLYAYHRWADARMIEALRRLTPEQYAAEPAPGWASVRATVVHLADGADIWSRRLAGETPTSRRSEADVPTLDDAERLLRDGHDAFDRHLAAATPERLAAAWSYRNFQGQTPSVPLWAVFRHVVNHATYHRGQVASKLKRFGVEPPVLDLVYWAIEQTPQ